MSDPTLDSRSRPPQGRRAIVVLLVDDQAFVGAALGLLLESEPDIELHSCLSAVTAIATANAIAPTLILQDLVMPEIDGLTLVRAFRTNPQTAGTPVVVLSGNDDTGSRARALAEGAKGYVVKLPPKAELIACIRQHASRSAGGSATLNLAVIDGFLRRRRCVERGGAQPERQQQSRACPIGRGPARLPMRSTVRLPAPHPTAGKPDTTYDRGQAEAGHYVRRLIGR